MLPPAVAALTVSIAHMVSSSIGLIWPEFSMSLSQPEEFRAEALACCERLVASYAAKSKTERRSRRMVTSKAEVAEGDNALPELCGLCDHLEDAVLQARIVGVGRAEMQVARQRLVLVR